MANISFFYPEKDKGLGLRAERGRRHHQGGGVQKVIPPIVVAGSGVSRAGLFFVPLAVAACAHSCL